MRSFHETTQGSNAGNRNRTARKPAGPAAVPVTILKWVCLVLLLVFLATRFSGSKVSTAAYEDVAAAVEEMADSSGMQKGDAQMIRRLYGLNPDDYLGMMLYYPSTNMNAEELLLVKLSEGKPDPEVEKQVVSAIEKRRQQQMDTFDGYAMEQYAMVEKALPDVQGNYVLYAAGEDADDVQRAFREAL
ncbi:MAG: DUF4358 domain-containing protein [Eubacterium sp.]|nr:DUF4358 domain-containing protein [Eubacterium sp.]